MSQAFRRLRAGEPVTPDWANGAYDAIQERTLLDSPSGFSGLRRVSTPEGYLLKATPVAAGGSVAATSADPWQPYLSAWQGTGADPDATTRKMRFRLTPGEIAGGAGLAFMSNLTEEFLAFGDPGNTTLTQDQAIWTQVYAKVAIEQTEDKTLQLDDGQILLAQTTGPAFDESALPEAIPDFDAEGNFPPYLVYPLRRVGYWGGVLHLDPSDPAIGSGVHNYLNVSLVVTDAGCETQSKAVQWTAT